MRDRYRVLNESFGRKFIFQYGRGFGFCAETIYLIKCISLCLSNQIQFTLGHQEPKGFSIRNGWEDYFLPLWPVHEGRLLPFLNRSHYPLGRLPIGKKIATIILHMVYGPHYYMSDNLGEFTNIFPEKLGLLGSYWQQMQQLSCMIWQFAPAVESTLQRYRSELNIQGSYVAAHVRRGDKETETSYTPLSCYLRALETVPASLPVYVATDDHRVIAELRKALPEREILSASRVERLGYDQIDFNKASPEHRYSETVFFLFELELMAKAWNFIGASPSNVFYLIRYLRGNSGIIDVGDC